MPKHPVKKKVGRPKKAGAVKKPVRRRVTKKGGAVKASTVLGSISGIAGGASVLSPATAIVTAPIAAIAGIGSAIASLFGGALTTTEMKAMMAIHANVQARKARR